MWIAYILFMHKYIYARKEIKVYSFLYFLCQGSLLLKIITPLINNIMQPEYYFYTIPLDSINHILENLDETLSKTLGF